MKSFFVFLGRYGVYFLIFLIPALATYSWFQKNFLSPFDSKATESVFFEVPKGATLNTIADELEKRGIIRWHYSMIYMSKLRSGGANRIIAGEYELSPSMTPTTVLDVLVSGKIVQHALTIPEGTTVADLPKLMVKTTLVTEEEAQQAIRDRSLLVQLSIPALTPEGYIYPETYNFSRPTKAQDMIIRIVEEGRKNLDLALNGWKERASQLGYTPHQVLVLASIIEKETGQKGERDIISSVFHNRLRIDMPLQSDPTVIYGIADFNGNLTKEQLQTPGPYNTYLNKGLPPTPICNPGIESIKAALYPADTDYLYFVGKGNGAHYFSKTYKEHQRAVMTYQQVPALR